MHVVYGIPALKTHAKCILVVRREGDGVRHYVHIGTGNYNPKTARLYTDLGLFTADPEIGADIAEMFNYLTGYARPRGYRKVAGRALQPPGGDPRRDRAHDRGALRRAAGADPDEDELAARRALDPGPLPRLAGRRPRSSSTCAGSAPCGPGVPGVSENIEVVSVVGRFLEHSRIYSFERPGEERAGLHRLRRPDAAQPLQPRRAGHPDRGREVRPELARRARPLPRRQHSMPGSSARTASWTRRRAGRRAAQRPARADRAPRDARRRDRLADRAGGVACAALAANWPLRTTRRAGGSQEAELTTAAPAAGGRALGRPGRGRRRIHRDVDGVVR